MTDLREKIKAAIESASHIVTDRNTVSFVLPAKTNDQIADAVLAAIEDAGYKVVDPENVTDEMTDAFCKKVYDAVFTKDEFHQAYEDVREPWRAAMLAGLRVMLAAAPKVTP